MAALGSLLLSSTKPDRLRDFYATAFSPKVERTPGDGPGYDVLDFDGFYVMIDTRDDIGDTNPEPGRVLLNFDVEDARSTVDSLNAAGATWLAELEDRDGSYFATAIDPDGNYVQIIQLSAEHRAQMERK
ncbi:putative glyoxalase superfamily protein PhnB [Herbihabitans rhizosphaerae]|uniref:Putative glyoxalase superfamily protein PhnB n=1 Tax=Herbihabitans rhizosphaerae TaxID=1872711 RepID=A0A4Q7KMP3_9PSEU|nr:VOC family protein [Herbihabitans rhizosphaerae]RZS36472.1 putative glyoxalase superfamily protein PhnB [Herbihabitans rhizosphaerae]